MLILVRAVVVFALSSAVGGAAGWWLFSPGFRAPPAPAFEHAPPATSASATTQGAPATTPEAGEAHAGPRDLERHGVGPSGAVRPGVDHASAAAQGSASPHKSPTPQAQRHADRPSSPQAARPAKLTEPAKAAQTGGADEVLVPSHTTRDRDNDPDLLPRGPDAWVDIDLAAAQLPSLTIRAGQLERDGAGSWRRFARRRKVGALSGRQARVALLHIGFDGEGQAVMAHVRTPGPNPIEGVIPLRVNDRPLVLRRAVAAHPPVATATDER